jgi:hypothetical protein
MEEKLASLAPGRLAHLLSEGLRGHHLLFDPGAIRAAFETPDEPLSRDDADDVGRTLLAICRDPIDVARLAVDAMPESARIALIRLYFRLLERAQSEQGLTH